jgi:hypothetical protein
VKLATSLAVALLLCCCGAALAVSPSVTSQIDNAELIAEKNAHVTGVPDPQFNVGGDNIGSAVNIPALPYSDSGNTCSFLNDYDEVCPFTGSTSPDVVYSYTAGSTGGINVSICNSLYDTKIYVYENAAGNLVGCNDDACGTDGFKSEIEGVPVTAGNTYYIVVDGYFGACGSYDLSVSENVPCVVSCPPGSVAEGEPVCSTNYVDTFNGGCNSVPPVFSPLCGASTSVCGQYGGFTFNGLDYRDTDWYSVVLDAATNVTFCVEGELGTLMGVIDGNAGCPVTAFLQSLVIGDCDPGCINIALGAGTWWFFVAPSDFGPALPCGSDYVMTLDGGTCPPISVENASWGEIKGMYK